MAGFSNLKISTRMHLLVGLALIGLLALCVASLLQLKSNMLEDRKEKTRNLVEVGIGVFEYHYGLVQAGKLTEEQGKEAARETLRRFRYDKDNYYFAFNTKGVYFLHPAKSEWEGTDKYDLKDSEGKFLVREIIAVAQQGGGFVDYHFARPGQTNSLPKLSYAAEFKPWGIVLGTGIYIDDIDTAFRSSAIALGGISILLLAALAGVGLSISSSITRQLGGEPGEASQIMERVARGDLTGAAVQAPPGSLLHALAQMVDALRTLVREIDRGANSLVAHAEQIAGAAREISGAAAEQSEATSSMAAGIEQLTVSSNHISDRETLIKATLPGFFVREAATPKFASS